MHGKGISQLDKNTYTRKVLEAEDTLYHISKTILDNEKDCEDAVQETILKSYEKLYTLREERYFKTWLIRILMNECYNIRRSVRVTLPYEEYMSGEEEQREDYSQLYEALRELPEKFRLPLVLYYVEGYALKEIKVILDIPEGTVKSRLSKGRKLLKTKLECR